MYLPPSEPLNVPALEQLIAQLPSPYMLLGDFNAHNVVWGSDSDNNRGNVIYKFISDNNLCLMNDGSYTYLHPGSGTFTAIDLSLCTPGIFMDLDFPTRTAVITFPLCYDVEVQLLKVYPGGTSIALSGLISENYASTRLK